MKLQTGDLVALKVVVPVKDYFYCVWLGGRGQYHSADLLPGTMGVVIRSHTPSVFKSAKEPYFANVDVEVAPGQIVRVRPFHSEIKKASATNLTRKALA